MSVSVHREITTSKSDSAEQPQPRDAVNNKIHHRHRPPRSLLNVLGTRSQLANYAPESVRTTWVFGQGRSTHRGHLTSRKFLTPYVPPSVPLIGGNGTHKGTTQKSYNALKNLRFYNGK